MEERGKRQGERDTRRMRERAGQGQRLLAVLQGVVGIPQIPQEGGEPRAAKHLEVLP